MNQKQGNRKSYVFEDEIAKSKKPRCQSLTGPYKKSEGILGSGIAWVEKSLERNLKSVNTGQFILKCTCVQSCPGSLK
jgi:hypothetical protein